MLRALLVAGALCVAAVGLLAAPANADSYLAQQHRQWAVNNFGPAFCAQLDAEPTALNVYNFTQRLVGLRLSEHRRRLVPRSVRGRAILCLDRRVGLPPSRAGPLPRLNRVRTQPW
jgi:hypothetical protein